MKTHISNTKAIEIYTDVMGKTMFSRHQEQMHSGNIKPAIVTRRKEQVKIVNNNKREINQNPKQHVNQLFKNLTHNKYKSTIDNKPPKHYQSGKKILENKLKKNPQENFVKEEHERELRSQAERVKNCKNLTQRRKDNTDPIVNPTYFMVDGSNANSVTIENYRNTVLKKNRPVSAVPAANNGGAMRFSASHYEMQGKTAHDDQPMQKFGSVPNYGRVDKKRPQTAGRQTGKVGAGNENDSLPECNFKAILNHIIDNKMFRDTDMKVLYVRLCHKYGEEKVDEIWEYLMDELES